MNEEQEIEALRVTRKRGRPRGLPCQVCGGRHYARPAGTTLDLCRKHYDLRRIREYRDKQKGNDFDE